MTSKTLVTAAIILVLGGGAIAIAAGGDRHGDHEARHQARMDRLFDAYDINADGQISKAEISAGREARFSASDANGDGVLSEAEIRAAALKRAEARADRMVKRIMDRADDNGDGSISLAEFQDTPRHRGDRMMKRLDSDGDGVITRAEAEAAKGWRHGRKHDKKAD